MYDADFVGLGFELELKPGSAGTLGKQISRELDHPVPKSGLLNRIALARGRLERARSRVASMRSDLGEVDLTHLKYRELLSHLHVLERSHFSRQLELDALLKERRQASVGPHRQPACGGDSRGDPSIASR